MSQTAPSSALSSTGTPEPTDTARVGKRLLTALYTTQFIGVGFLSTGLVAILRDSGVALSTLATIQLLGLLWPLKFLWAPLVDRFALMRGVGHYKSWLIVLQSGMVLSLLALALVTDPKNQLGLIILVAGLFVIMSATQDIAADALAVRGLAVKDRGLGSAIQVSASYLGNLVGGAGAVIVADRWGLPAAAVLLAAATGIALIPVLRHREKLETRVRPLAGAELPRTPRPKVSVLQGLRNILGVFAQPACRSWCLISMPLLYMGSAGVYALVTPALTDSGRSLTEIGLITVLWASPPAIIAGLGTGWLLRKISRILVLSLGGLILAGGILLLLPLFASQGSNIMTGAGVACLLSGYTVINVVVYLAALEFTRADRAGSDFTLLTCLPLALSFIAAWMSLTIASFAGYSLAAWMMGTLVLGGILAASIHHRRFPHNVSA